MTVAGINYRIGALVFAVLWSSLLATAALAESQAAPVSPLPLLPGFRQSAWFREQIREEWLDSGVRVVLNAPEIFDPTLPTTVIIYATPNGNTIEQTLGSELAKGTDWHFDIQHIAAQTRRLREVQPRRNIVLACIQNDLRSWPAWRQKYADNAARIQTIVDGIKSHFSGASTKVTLTGHSGGGSFLFGFINSAETIPDYVERIAFLDANYSYSDIDRHGEKLLAWLRKDSTRHLDVIAYDDRNIMLDGKKVVGPDGGTFRATQRMLTFLRKNVTITESRDGNMTTSTALEKQIVFRIHANPQNKILHTALVGEMNGFLEAMSVGTPETAAWGTFGGPRAYTMWVQPASVVPSRATDAPAGGAFFKQLEILAPADREEKLFQEIRRGNIPNFLRTFHTIDFSLTTAEGKTQKVVIEVMPDYLAVGNDQDYVRAPMTPMTAQKIADAFDCVLPTRKIVDAIYQKASVKREPLPLTEDREAAKTFAQHNAIIEAQRKGTPVGALVAGIKKDVVLTNRLGEKPNRVAIYGWHKPGGTPIQPLTIVHKETYVDYSHGIRLIRRTALVDGKPRDIRDILRDPVLFAALSDEGPILRPTY
ncbi:MAG: hypothetical protein V4671_26185 [Armatimonadota bacterium]